MQKCSSCGADLPENSRFCGKCGNVQDTTSTDAAPTMVNTPQPQSWMPEGGTIVATWSANVQEPVTPPPATENEDEDEQRKGILPLSPFYGVALGTDALLGSGQPYTGGAPVVQGTPQPGSISSVAGSPTSSTNAPVTHPVQEPVNAPATHPVQGPGNAAPVSHPVQGPANAPIGHPVQGPTNAPIVHPVQGPSNPPHPQPGPQPVHQPPEQPEPPPTHKHHRHHKHSEEHEQRQHHTHTTRHEPHRAARMTRVAGGSSVKTIILVVVAVAVVAAGGVVAATHFLSHPQPLMSVSSNYKVGNTPAGASGTVLHISGQQFASNSAITFLLDGQAAPGNQGTNSDANGNFSTDVTITSAWSVGTHILTARDASNNSTQHSVSVNIVQPGQANTPGPDGAPPDDASFKVIAKLQRQATAGNPYSAQEIEIVTGHPDPLGGTVCQTEDTGQPIIITGITASGSVPFRETVTLSCTGSYKGGKLTLTEMFKSDVIVYSEPDGTMVTCTLISSQPVVDEQVSGSYTGNNTFRGTVTYPTIPGSGYSCNNSYSYNSDRQSYNQVNWTGQVTDLHS